MPPKGRKNTLAAASSGLGSAPDWSWRSTLQGNISCELSAGWGRWACWERRSRVCSVQVGRAGRGGKQRLCERAAVQHS